MRHRAVQIVCTIGPASREPDRLEGLIEAGMSVARLNFAHGTVEEHRETVGRIRAASQRRGEPVAILQDLAGPKLRLGKLAEGRVHLESGAEVVLICGRDAEPTETGSAQPTSDPPTALPVPDPYLAREVQPGGPILIGDGAVELEVLAVESPEIRARVISGGELSSGKGINAPGGLSARPLLEAKDVADLELGTELGVDLVGVSYVRDPQDLLDVRRRLRSLGRPVPLVAKIETAHALENLEGILAKTDAVMIARGDLSLEIPYERVPMEQKRIVRLAIQAGRPVITATQMLQSMVQASRPTRAEATDVANAVLDGTDAVMLSDETAVGADPVRACRTMARIVEATQAAHPEFPEPDVEGIAAELRELAIFSRAAVRTAREVGARAILTWSRGGLAARLLSRQRPGVPILTPTRDEETWRRLALLYGVRPLLCPRGRLRPEQLQSVLGKLDGQDLLLVVGHHPGETRRIPWMGLVRVLDTEGWERDPRDSGRFGVFA
ncbi:MAG: pyruvate kinase [Myxococcota bacterium]